MKIFSKNIFYALLLTLTSTSLLGKLEQDLASLEVELTMLARFLPKISPEQKQFFKEEKKQQIPEFKPESFDDIEIEPSSFSDDSFTHYSVSGANKTITEIASLLETEGDNLKEAKKIVDDLLSNIKKATGKADKEQRKNLISNLYKLIMAYPLTMETATESLEKMNQYDPSRVFQMLGKLLNPSIAKFNKEIKEEVTRNALTMADQSKRTLQRRFISENFKNALLTINLVLDQYDKYKEYPLISTFDKNQFFGEILFNWQAIKNGYKGIQELSEEDQKHILNTTQPLPTVKDPNITKDNNLEDYFLETQRRIEGVGQIEETIKPLRILLGKITAKLRSPTKETENAVKNFVKAQLPTKMDESAAFLDYNYSEFDTPEKKAQVIAALKAAADNGIKGTDEAKILSVLAQEIDYYGSFRQDNDELEELINQIKTDETKFASTETIENIIKKIEGAGKKSERLNDSTARRNKKADKELKESLEKTKQAINIGIDIAPALADALSNFCAPGDVQNQINFHIKGEKVKFNTPNLGQQKYSPGQQDAIKLYQNSFRDGQILILQSIMSNLINKCATPGAVKCSICTQDAIQKIQEEILTENPNAPEWVRKWVKKGGFF